jgi:predicted TPR repeat methyltransferase
MKTEVLAAYRRAATEAAHLLETNPTDGAAWIRLALYRVKSGSRDQASALLPKFEQFPVTDLDSKLMKARLLELLGARKQALILLAECAAEGTTNFEMESLSDLAQLRHDPGYARLVRERLGSTNN